jgi:dienelactone hydrolase
VMIDLASGQTQRPCPACDLARLPWRWSPDGMVLLAAARTRVTSSGAGASSPTATIKPGGYRYWQFGVGGAAAPLSDHLVPGETATQGGLETAPLGDVAWIGGRPAILAHGLSTTRLDWWRIGIGAPVNLTARLPASAGRAMAKGEKSLLLGSGGSVFVLGSDGLRRLAEPPVHVQLTAAPPGETAQGVLITSPGGGRIISAGGGEVPGPIVEADAELRALSIVGGSAALVRRGGDGASTLIVRGPGRAERSVLPLNPGLAGVASRPPVAIHHTGAGCLALTSWLYLPAAHQPGDRRPLIVVPYPGAVYGQAPADRRLDSTRLDTNVQVMVGAGYAVLVPSLPLPMDREPAPGLADAILAVVDAARLQQPGLSTTRLALWGQSFGGWGVLMAATQSPRFSAIIASAPITDFIAMHGGQRLAAIAAPELAFNAPGMQAYTETGQARMGAPPWLALNKYLRNSPRYQTDKITAPVLLLYGDLDFDPIQVMGLFTSLHRQRKDAQLVVYRGEQHVITSPGNIRDLYARAFSFLETVMPPEPATAREAIRPSQ